MLFDVDAEAAKLWQDLATAHGLQFRASEYWKDVDEFSDWANLLVLDQSAFEGPLVPKAAEICRNRPHQLVIVTGASLAVSDAVSLMHSGVGSVLEKPLDSQQLAASAVELVEEAKALIANQEEYQRLKSLFSDLTPRELDVLDYVLKGVPNKQTALRLHVSIRTIESRRAKVYRKLQTANVADLVRKIDRLDRLRQVFARQDDFRQDGVHQLNLPQNRCPRPKHLKMGAQPVADVQESA